MIKNRELALIPDSALELLEPPATSPVPGPRSSVTHALRTPRVADRHAPRRPGASPR
ncbi:hypothetical protein Acsp06_25750 [Actinomycetospora sp. NBRC 106375]|uniref:hypothetical protein n=1 Tax=Actinomycetospora sp. NBRC 106375 TaxID=3032207 RepID=UPI0024A373F0|nr:hypothetical protein [Actinomycetospora sp. NBRC 106375]GLZ46390.1 hypothetical protein Acsp06_25750 [Actinomycetospora sp. NBRC 106375]